MWIGFQINPRQQFHIWFLGPLFCRAAEALLCRKLVVVAASPTLPRPRPQKFGHPEVQRSREKDEQQLSKCIRIAVSWETKQVLTYLDMCIILSWIKLQGLVEEGGGRLTGRLRKRSSPSPSSSSSLKHDIIWNIIEFLENIQYFKECESYPMVAGLYHIFPNCCCIGTNQNRHHICNIFYHF